MLNRPSGANIHSILTSTGKAVNLEKVAALSVYHSKAESAGAVLSWGAFGTEDCFVTEPFGAYK